VIQKLQQFARRMIRKFGLLNELNHLKTRFGCRGGQLRAEEFGVTRLFGSFVGLGGRSECDLKFSLGHL